MNSLSTDSRRPNPPLFSFDQTERTLFWQWAGVTAIGIFAFSQNSIFFALGLAILTIGQWLLLRPRLKGAAWWLCVTPICLFWGFGLSSAFVGVLQDHMDNVVSSPMGIAPLEAGRSISNWFLANIITIAIGALVLGFSQSLVLGHAAGAWIPANLIASAALLPLPSVPGAVGQLLASVWFGVVTGLALVRCLRQRKVQTDQPARRLHIWIWVVLAVIAIIGSSLLVPIVSHPYMRATYYETVGDNVQAYRFFYVAGTPNGLARVAQEMTSAEIAEAERLAKEWLAAHPQE